MGEKNPTSVSVTIHMNEPARFHLHHKDTKFVSIDLGQGNFVCAGKEQFESLISVCAEAVYRIKEAAND